MLTSISWIPKGGMKPVPLLSTDSEEKVQMKLKKFQVELDNFTHNSHTNLQNTLSQQQQHQQEQEQQQQEQLDKGIHNNVSTNNNKHGNNDNDDEDDENENGEEVASALLQNDNVNSTLRDIAGGGSDAVLEQIDSDNDDDNDDQNEEDGRKEEKEDVQFRDTDLVFAVSVADNTQPRIELYTYDEPQDVLFIHHDMEVAAFPLCTEWLTDGNMSLLAVGTMLPMIEIWALDVMDSVEPALTLGGCASLEMNYLPRSSFMNNGGGGSIKQSKKVMKRHLKPHSHTEGVLALKWNTIVQHLICSGSADHTIKLWDLNAQDTCVSTFNDTEKIQSLDWNVEEPHLLLSGGYNKHVSLRDCRAASQEQRDNNSSNGTIGISLNDVVEHVEFVPHSPLLMASTSLGQWTCMDVRMCSSSSNNNRNCVLWSFAPHGDGEITFNCSKQVNGLFATGGKDGKISLWDGRTLNMLTQQQPSSNATAARKQISTSYVPKEIVTRDYKTGIVLGLQFHPNSPHILGAAGSRGEPLVYTMTSDLINVFQ